MKQWLCSCVIISAFTFTGASYAAKSLWGDIDMPQDESKAVEVKGSTVNSSDIQNMVKPGTAKDPSAVTKTTTCDVLQAAATLDTNFMNSDEIKAAIRNLSSQLAQQYKPMIASQASLMSLYNLYRQQYLKKYCG